MNSNIMIAIITASGSVIVAALSFYLTKRNQLNIEWRREKIAHYNSLLRALSDLAVDGTDKRAAGEAFSRALNMIVLYAPQHVIKALMNFHDEAKWSNPNKLPERHDELLVALVAAIRKDVGLRDDRQTFGFHLVGVGPTKQ